MSTGNNTLAVQYYKQCIGILRRLYGIGETLGTAYHNLGVTHECMGDYGNATESLRKAVNIYRILNDRSDTMVISLMNYATSYVGNPTRYLTLLNEAYNIRAEIGLKHFSTGQIQFHRGRMQLSLEQFHRAADSFENAVDIFVKEEGLRPQHMAEALLMWGVALKKLGRLEEAERRLTKSLKISERVSKDNGIPCEKENNLKDALRELGEVKSMMGRR